MGCLCSSKKVTETKGEKREFGSVSQQPIIKNSYQKVKKESIDSKITPIEVKVIKKENLTNKNETSKLSTSNLTSVKKLEEKQNLITPNDTPQLKAKEIRTEELNTKKSHLEVQNNIVPDSKNEDKLNSSIHVLKKISREVNSRRNSKFEEVVYEFELKPDPCEIMLEAWCTCNMKLVFEVNGEWQADENMDKVDSNGYKNYPVLENKFHLGALLCRVGGDTAPLNIAHKIEYTPTVSGPLFCWMNLHNLKFKPQGQLKLKIKNATKTSREEIRKKLGWNITKTPNDFLSEEENEQLFIINTLRSNPPLFAKVYLSHLAPNSENIKTLYDFLLLLKPLPILNFNKNLKIVADKLCNDLSISGRFSNEDSEGNDAEQRLKNIINSDKDLEVLENICVDVINNPFRMVLKMLIDEQVPTRMNRKNLLNNNLKYIGISTKSHQKWGWMSVIDFTEVDY